MESHTDVGEAGSSWRLRHVVPVVLLWMTLHEHVAVALRNQKVRLSGDNGRVTQVANTVSIPTLNQLTICFEVQRNSAKQEEWLFTYYDSSNKVVLSLGASGNHMTMIINGQNCTPHNELSPAYFTSQMTPVCLAWSSQTGRVAAYLNGTHRPSSCYPSAGHPVPGGGTFRLGGQQSFDGYIYNLRLWEKAMSEDELKKLKCDAKGNVFDWDQSNWTIPETLAQTDTTLSCSVSPTSKTPTTSKCDSSILYCLVYLYYKASLVVTDRSSALSLSDIEEAVYNWLMQSFSYSIENIYPYQFRKCSLQSGGGPASYKCKVLLEKFYTTNNGLDKVAVSTWLSSRVGHIGHGLQIQPSSITVRLIVETCPKENSGGYTWPETSFLGTRDLPCLYKKDKTAHRTCWFDQESFSLSWSPVDDSQCGDISDMIVSADNAMEAANELVNYTDNTNLSVKKILGVVKRVEELVNIPKINSTLAFTVIAIISNVMTNFEAQQADYTEISAQ